MHNAPQVYYTLKFTKTTRNHFFKATEKFKEKMGIPKSPWHLLKLNCTLLRLYIDSSKSLKAIQF